MEKEKWNQHYIGKEVLRQTDHQFTNNHIFLT